MVEFWGGLLKKTICIGAIFIFVPISVVLFQNCSGQFAPANTFVQSSQSNSDSALTGNDRSLLLNEMDAVLKDKSTNSIFVTTDNFHTNNELPEGVTPKRPLLNFFTQGKPANISNFLQMANSYSNGTAFSSEGTSRFENCGQGSTDSQLWIYTYGKPYMQSQPAYIEWIKSITANSSDKLVDFLPPKARSFNGWLGARACPINPKSTTSAIESDFLKRSLGQSIAKDVDDSIVLTLDNRYNPYRWLVPFNETHHVEAPSMAFLRRSTSAEKVATEIALADYTKGPKAGAAKQASVGADEIYLDYDLELTVIDHSSEMKENSYTDVLQKDFHNDFLSQIYVAARDYGNRAYFTKRLVPKTFQFSLMVNWAEVGGSTNSSGLYRLSEIMMASQNYQSVFSSDAKFVPTKKANFDMNPYIVEGGAEASVAWFRTHADAYHNFHQSRGSEYGNLYPFSSDFRHQNLGSSGPLKMKGSINISKFYKLLKDSDIFPGQQFNPNEVHRIHWVGAIFEAHGPYEVHLKIKKMNLSIQKSSASCSGPKPCTDAQCLFTATVPPVAGAVWTKGAAFCGYTCRSGYSGEKCQTYTDGSTTPVPSSAKQVVYRLRLQSHDYLYSISDSETASAVNTSGYVLEGPAFALKSGRTLATDKALLRCRTNNIHFLSWESNCEGQIVEGILGYVGGKSAPGMIRLLRYSKAGTYLTVLETSHSEIAAALKAGYKLEGHQGFAFP